VALDLEGLSESTIFRQNQNKKKGCLGRRLEQK
jgi:hypothetical protein